MEHFALVTEFVRRRERFDMKYYQKPIVQHILYIRREEDVSGSEATILVARDEKEDYSVCGKVFSMSASED